MNDARAKAMPPQITVATNNVPDGSVNVYNEDGEKVGTITAEEAEAAERNVGKIVIEEDGGK